MFQDCTEILTGPCLSFEIEDGGQAGAECCLAIFQQVKHFPGEQRAVGGKLQIVMDSVCRPELKRKKSQQIHDPFFQQRFAPGKDDVPHAVPDEFQRRFFPVFNG